MAGKGFLWSGILKRESGASGSGIYPSGSWLGKWVPGGAQASSSRQVPGAAEALSGWVHGQVGRHYHLHIPVEKLCPQALPALPTVVTPLVKGLKHESGAGRRLPY